MSTEENQRFKKSKTKIDFWDNNIFKVTNILSARDKKINTFKRFSQYKKINIKSPKDLANITPHNSTLNSNNGSNSSRFIISSKKPMLNSQISFFPKKLYKFKNDNEAVKETAVLTPKAKTSYKIKKIINIINLSKISRMFNSFDKLKPNRTFNIQKYETLETNQKDKKKMKINILEENFNKKYSITKHIKHEYQPNLQKFYINGALRNYIKKSEKMINSKNDLNDIYKNSSLLNNIIDFISARLYKYRKDINEKTKIEIRKKNSEKLYKRILNFKIKRGEIIQDKIFHKKEYLTYDDKINQKLKAKLIYKNGYSSNSFKVLKNRIFTQQQIDLVKSYKKEFSL